MALSQYDNVFWSTGRGQEFIHFPLEYLFKVEVASLVDHVQEYKKIYRPLGPSVGKEFTTGWSVSLCRQYSRSTALTKRPRVHFQYLYKDPYSPLSLPGIQCIINSGHDVVVTRPRLTIVLDPHRNAEKVDHHLEGIYIPSTVVSAYAKLADHPTFSPRRYPNYAPPRVWTSMVNSERRNVLSLWDDRGSIQILDKVSSQAN